MKKIDLNTLDNVVGGQINVVNNTHKGYPYVNCRKRPGLNEPLLFTISNGTEVYPTGQVVHKDNINWYEIQLGGMNDFGWVAGHLIGYRS